jgi:hypothetical protein
MVMIQHLHIFGVTAAVLFFLYKLIQTIYLNVFFFMYYYI